MFTIQSFDGTEAIITFVHRLDKSNIIIERNKLKIELPQTKADKKLQLLKKAE
jgi:hypothetical protein